MVNGVVTPESQLDSDVVDEARRADFCGRNQAHGPTRLLQRFKREDVHKRKIIDWREARGFQSSQAGDQCFRDIIAC